MMVVSLYILTFILGFFSGLVLAVYVGYRYNKQQQALSPTMNDAEERLASRIAEHLVNQSRRDVLS